MHFQTLFAYTEVQNRFDYYWYQNTLFSVVLFVAALIGLAMGWILWRGYRERCLEIERQNSELRAEAARRRSEV